MNDVIEEPSYQLRYADSNEGERCVCVNDMIEWLLSIVDGEVTSEQCEVVKIIIDQLEKIKEK